jgi:hypothetical protein
LFSGLLSGNALVAATVFGAAGLLLARQRPRWRWPIALLSGALVLLIGWARIERDLDLPSGVLAGLAVSSLLLLIGTYALERLETVGSPGGGGAASAPDGQGGRQVAPRQAAAAGMPPRG